MKTNRAMWSFQMKYYIRRLLVLVLLYLIVMAASYVSVVFFDGALHLESVSLLFFIFMVVAAWLNFSMSLTFFSYHGFSRKQIIRSLALAQLCISLLTAVLSVAHNLLVTSFSLEYFVVPETALQTVYLAEWTNEKPLLYALSLLFIWLCFFTGMQLGNTLAAIAYRFSRLKVFVLLSLLAAAVIGLVLGFAFLPAVIRTAVITAIRFLLGLNQTLVPKIVVPAAIIVIGLLLSFWLTRKAVARVDIRNQVD